MSFRLCAPLRWRLHLVRHDCNPAHRGIVTTLLPGKGRWMTTAQEVENTNVCHSQFLAEASGKAKWRDPNGGKGGTEATGEDLDTITDGKGMSEAVHMLSQTHTVQGSYPPLHPTYSNSYYLWGMCAVNSQSRRPPPRPASSRRRRLPYSFSTPPSRYPTYPA